MELRRERTPALPDPALNGLYALMPDEKSPLVAAGETTADRAGRLTNKVRLEYSRAAAVPAARTELEQVGPDELRGQWRQRERQGLEVWRRSQPSITHVRFQSSITDTVVRGVAGRVQVPYRDDWDKAGMSLGTRPEFRITVYGSDLWGWPDLRMLEGRGLLPAASGGVYFIGADREANASWVYINKSAPGVVGFTFRVILDAGSAPGRKSIRINGIPISFDLLIPGYPKGPDAFPARSGPSLRFVKLTGSTFSPVEGGITPGETVSVEARYEDPPAGNTAEITLEWAEGSRRVTVHRTPESRNLYRSFPITISTTQGAGRPDR